MPAAYAIAITPSHYAITRFRHAIAAAIAIAADCYVIFHAADYRHAITPLT